MKEAELVALGKCCICGEPLLGHAKSTPTFYTVTVAHHGLNLGALQRRFGLGLMLGNNDILARALGPDEDLTQQVGEDIKLFVHETCAASDTSLYAMLGTKEN